MEVDIIVTTFGSRQWERRGAWAADEASHQAIASHYHATDCRSLGDARNRAVDTVDPQEWICFLDADDELAPGYIDAMEASHDRLHEHRYLYVPQLRIGDGPIMSLAQRDIMRTNPCPIGTIIHRETFERAGWFWDEPAWEDWSLFRRAFMAGAPLVFVPGAVYHAHSTPSGRNSTIPDTRGLRRQIERSHKEWARARR